MRVIFNPIIPSHPIGWSVLKKHHKSPDQGIPCSGLFFDLTCSKVVAVSIRIIVPCKILSFPFDCPVAASEPYLIWNHPKKSPCSCPYSMTHQSMTLMTEPGLGYSMLIWCIPFPKTRDISYSHPQSISQCGSRKRHFFFLFIGELLKLSSIFCYNEGQ